MRRVAHLLHSLDVGGAEMLVARIARAQPESVALLLCLDRVGTLGEQLRAEGFPVACVDRSAGLDWKIIGRLRKELEASGATVLHCHQYTPWFWGSLAAMGAKLPVIFTEHGRHLPDRPRPKRILFNPLLRRQTRATTAVSKSILEALVANEKFSRDQVEVLYNGIDPMAFGNENGARARLRQSMGIGEDTFVIGHAGRLVEVKHQSLLLRAFAAYLKSHHPPTRLQIAGEGELDGSLKSLAKSLGIDDQVDFLGRRDDLPDLLMAWDAFALSSHSEGTSVTLLEAMASRRPVVATAVGGNPELIEDEKQGLLVPASDEVAMSLAFDRLVADANLCRSMGQAGRATVEARFHFDSMLGRFGELWDEAVEGFR